MFLKAPHNLFTNVFTSLAVYSILFITPVARAAGPFGTMTEAQAVSFVQGELQDYDNKIAELTNKFNELDKALDELSKLQDDDLDGYMHLGLTMGEDDLLLETRLHNRGEIEERLIRELYDVEADLETAKQSKTAFWNTVAEPFEKRFNRKLACRIPIPFLSFLVTAYFFCDIVADEGLAAGVSELAQDALSVGASAVSAITLFKAVLFRMIKGHRIA